jgi:hypothetical protein
MLYVVPAVRWPFAKYASLASPGALPSFECKSLQTMHGSPFAPSPLSSTHHPPHICPTHPSFPPPGPPPFSQSPPLYLPPQDSLHPPFPPSLPLRATSLSLLPHAKSAPKACLSRCRCSSPLAYGRSSTTTSFGRGGGAACPIAMPPLSLCPSAVRPPGLPGVTSCVGIAAPHNFSRVFSPCPAGTGSCDGKGGPHDVEA